MKQFVAFVHKEFMHIFRDGRTILILIWLPVVQILLFGFAINMEVTNIRLAVLDQANDSNSLQITQHFVHNPYFSKVHKVSTMAEINALLQGGDMDVAIVFPKDFQQDFIRLQNLSIQVIADASDPNRGSIISGYIEGVFGQYFRLMQQHNEKVPYSINSEGRMMYNPLMKSAYNFVPGIMGLVLLLICSIMTSISIVREKERGTMEVLLVSPMKPSHMLIAKTIPYLAISLIDLGLILLLSFFVLHVPIRGSFFSLLLVSVVYIFLALSLGLFISSRANTQVAAILMSGMGMMMPALVLSGMIFPIDNMPAALQWISSLVPTRWYISAVKKVMIQGVGLCYVWKEMIVLCGMIVFLITGTILSLKKRIE